MSTRFPTWIDVHHLLALLGEDVASLENFRQRDGYLVWRWAIRQRGHDGNDGPHIGPSPWLSFASGQSAVVVRRLLPLWVSARRLRALSADELATEVLNDPDQRRRYQLSRVVAEHVAAHAGDWGWLRDLVRALNPDPFADHFDHVLPRNGGQLAAQRPASAHTGSRESRRPTLRRTHEAG